MTHTAPGPLRATKAAVGRCIGPMQCLCCFSHQRPHCAKSESSLPCMDGLLSMFLGLQARVRGAPWLRLKHAKCHVRSHLFAHSLSLSICSMCRYLDMWACCAELSEHQHKLMPGVGLTVERHRRRGGCTGSLSIFLPAVSSRFPPLTLPLPVSVFSMPFVYSLANGCG